VPSPTVSYAKTMTGGRAPLKAAGGAKLKAQLRRSARRSRVTAFGLVVPLLAFILASFVLPIGNLLYRSIYNPTVVDVLPEAVAALRGWDGTDAPDEAVFAALAADLVAARKAQTLGPVASRLNFDRGGMRSLVTKTAREIEKVEEGPYKPAFLEIDERWGEVATWTAIRANSERYTATFYVAAMDHTFDSRGHIVSVAPELRIYIELFVRTVWVSAVITGLCLALGFPIAYLMATVPTRYSNLLLIAVLLPFWTSLLVRTTSWVVILQREGVINEMLIWLGLIGEDQRLALVYNMTGTILAMTQILLPFMVLPLFSVMKTIPSNYMRAAQSLGASPEKSFLTVYLPNTIPGIGAGSILVFILAIGYYITPALVGGRTGQLIGNFIAYHMQSSLNWGLAGALGGILLAGVLGLYFLYNRLIGIDKLKLG
jgi:putative spermidine/putrescine transport system permease protein